MEKIELFDKYINDQLSDKDREVFDNRLKSDKEFAFDFKVYLFTINGICREAHQDNLDFGLAMKKLSKEQLKEIIGKRHDDNIGGNMSDEQDSSTFKAKTIKLKPWIWQTASIAAIIVIAFTAVFNIEKNARDSIDNAIYVCADISQDLVRSGGKTIDITTMSDDELKVSLTEIVSLYKSSASDDDIADNGFALAMAYLRLHDRDNAKKILEQLVFRFDGNADYIDYVHKWKSILVILK